MELNVPVRRYEDMSPDGFLQLIQQPDGDVCIMAFAPKEHRKGEYNVACIEFCYPGGGGGESRHTLRALKALGDAMELDNKEREQHRG